MKAETHPRKDKVSNSQGKYVLAYSIKP